MGKRSGMTKSGRVMNPADRERKKQRAQELKRNKKQRTQIRTAIVKSKDADELLEQLRRLDDQEFNPKCELSQHVILEKRAKLRGALTQQLGLYRQENNLNQVTRLENLMHEYENDRLRKEQQFHALMFSNDTNIADIPLPSGSMIPNAAMTPFVPAPQPPQFHPAMSGILKKSSGDVVKIHKVPPGPPCGVPPSFRDDLNINQGKSRKVKFAPVQYDTPVMDDFDIDDDDLGPVAMPDSLLPQRSSFQPVRAMISAPPIPPNMAPPPPRGGMPYYMNEPIRTAPPPPAFQTQPVFQTPVAPQPIDHQAPISRSGAVISAEPQMRNLKKEATRFVPTAVQVGKPDNIKPRAPARPNPPKAPTRIGQSADEACDEFLREISDLF